MKYSELFETFDWSPSGGSRTIKIGNTTIIYGVGKDNTCELISLRTTGTKRGNGSARAAMQEFTKEASENGFTIKLGASPLDKKTNFNKLFAFYQSFGFEPTGRKINMAGEPEMIRLP